MIGPSSRIATTQVPFKLTLHYVCVDGSTISRTMRGSGGVWVIVCAIMFVIVCVCVWQSGCG